MTPEQRKRLEIWAARRSGTMPTYGQTEVAANAALALIDKQQAALDKQGLELESLRFFATLFAQDNADLMEAGAMREREACARLVCSECRDGLPTTLLDGTHWHEDRYGKHWGCMARHILARGPLLPPFPPEQLAAENKQLREVLGKVVALASDAFQGLDAWRDALTEARKLLGEAGR